MYRPSALRALRPSQFQLPVCTSQEPPEVPVFTGGAPENCSLTERQNLGKTHCRQSPTLEVQEKQATVCANFIDFCLKAPTGTSIYLIAAELHRNCCHFPTWHLLNAMKLFPAWDTQDRLQGWTGGGGGCESNAYLAWQVLCHPRLQ